MYHTLAAYYSIRVQGVLDRTWESWFEGMIISSGPEGENETCINGIVRDQTALHGMLLKIRDLNLVLVAVEREPV